MARRIAGKTHEWITDRAMEQPCVVLRIDDYSCFPLSRGQFVPLTARSDDNQKAIWPTRELAGHAAEWAAKKFGRTYGVFQMLAIVEPAEAPIKVTAL